MSRRCDWKPLLDDRARLDQLILQSGGYLRDLFRLLQATLRRARTGTLPVSDATIALAIHEVRNDYLPLTTGDARWLASVRRTHQPQPSTASADGDDETNLYNLARFLDTHMMLCYRDGREWYDVHPLIQDEVRRQATS